MLRGKEEMGMAHKLSAAQLRRGMEALRDGKIAGCRMPPDDRAKRNIACLIRDLSHCSPKTAGETADWVIRQVLYDAWHDITPQMIKAGEKVLSSYEAKAPPDLLATEVFGAMLLVLINSQDPEE